MAKSVKKPAPKPKAAAKPRKPASRKPARSKRPELSREQVALLAHRYYAERGFQHGHDEDDWFRAESELREQVS